MGAREAAALKRAFGKLNDSVRAARTGPTGAAPRVGTRVTYSGPGKDPGDYGQKFMEVFKKAAYVRATKKMEKIAAQIVKELKDVLNNQRYNWAPLRAAYLRWKIDHQLDTRILIATGLYRDSITWWKKGGYISVGVPPDKKTKEGVPLWLIAKVHEFGTRTIPSRPLWRPVLAKFLQGSRQFRMEYNREVNADLKKKLPRTRKTTKQSKRGAKK